MVPLRVGVLGPVTVWRDGREQAAGQPRQLAVLGVLATRANRVVSRGELVDAVWGDQPPASAEGGIYTYVAGLRRVIEPDRPRRDPDRSRQSPARTIVSGGGGYLLRLGAGGLDADHFGRCLMAARGLRADCDLDGALRAVDEALALWRGLPYAGVPGPFAEAEQRRLTELRTTAIEERAELLLARGQAAAAVPELTALTAAHPLREQTTGLLMIALYRCGRQAEALRVYGETRQRLAEDLGIDPGGELARIHRQLLAMDPALDGPVAAPPVTITAWPGRSGFSSAGGADRVRAETPPLRPGRPRPTGPERRCPRRCRCRARPSCRPRWPASPAGPPSCTGCTGCCRLRRRPCPGLRRRPRPAANPMANPVALITGTAGVGKTTLAIRFARQAASRFPDGQLYVNLRGFDPASAPVPPAAALQGFFDALGVLAPARAGRP